MQRRLDTKTRIHYENQACKLRRECADEIPEELHRNFTMLTPRDLSNMSVGQCKYILITNADGGILNDPILLRLGENNFWI